MSITIIKSFHNSVYFVSMQQHLVKQSRVGMQGVLGVLPADAINTVPSRARQTSAHCTANDSRLAKLTVPRFHPVLHATTCPAAPWPLLLPLPGSPCQQHFITSPSPSPDPAHNTTAAAVSRDAQGWRMSARFLLGATLSTADWQGITSGSRGRRRHSRCCTRCP